jgi:membrane-bound lytic murein transglycosylase D
MREKFMRGLIRSGAHMPEIERIFADAGLPTELAYLPHIESSFENRALSKVGAAGIWQIMPATGRRYLRVNGRVDERLHVPTATTAAAQIFQENYEQLGTWPLAITAYNHGLYGMKQAVETMGTTDFGIIFQYYRGPAFGFASQNFYPEFIAALDVARNYKRYFGDIYFDPPTSFPTMARQQRGSDSTDEQTPPRTFSAVPAPSRDTSIAEPNQYAQKPVTPVSRQGQDVNKEEKTAALSRPSRVTRQVHTPPSHDQQPATPEPERTYRVQAGDTFTAIARQFRTTTVQLAALNNLPRHYRVKIGETLTIAASPSPAVEKAPQRVAKVLASDTPSQSGTTKKAMDKVSSKSGVSKTALTTPSQPTPVKPTTLEATPTVVTTSARQRTAVKTAAAEPSNPARTSIVKTSPGKPVPPKAPASTTVASVPKTSPAEAGKPTAASTTKVAAGKVVTKSVPAETPKSAGVSTTKVSVTKSPGSHEEPKATPVSTRAPTRRPNPKGA